MRRPLCEFCEEEIGTGDHCQECREYLADSAEACIEAQRDREADEVANG